MMLLDKAQKNQQQAWEVIDELNITGIWESYGAKANLVGSLPTGLLMKNKDIDFHIYSDSFSIADSFGAMAKLAENPKIKHITYTNLLDTEEMCLEWHVWYEDIEKDKWKLDMIHILNTSPYAGKMEKVRDRINTLMTPELKMTILSIKNDIPDDKPIMGIEIYMAVLRDGVRNYEELLNWKLSHPTPAIIDWMP